MSQWIEAVGLVAGSGVVGGLVTKALDRRKDKAETHRHESEGTLFDVQGVQAIADAAVTLIAPLKREVEDLTGRVATLETENAATKKKLLLAIEYIRTLRSWVSNRITDQSPPPPPGALGI